METKGNLLKYTPRSKFSLQLIKEPSRRLSSGEVRKEEFAHCLEFFQITLEKTYYLPITKCQENDCFQVNAYFRMRPYHKENTGSRLITEVKPCRARSVLGWVTA